MHGSQNDRATAKMSEGAEDGVKSDIVRTFEA